MKMKTIWFIVILLIVATIFINLSLNKEKEEFKPLELNVGDIFTGIEYSNTMYVINYMIGDVTGDNEKDMIIAIGEKETVDSLFATKVDIVLYDAASKTFEKSGIKNFNGQNPKIILSDLTNDGIKDIIITLDNEDSSKNMRIITVKGGTMKEIFNQRDNRGLIFAGEIIDGVKAHLRCGKISKEMYIDLSDKKNDYIASKKIDESGKVICENRKVFTTGFITIDVVELNTQNGIQTTQRICAFDNNEIIDELTVIWKYENEKWQMKEAKGVRVGNLIY